MKNATIIVEPLFIDRITDSSILTDNEKISFLMHYMYLTWEEKNQLLEII